MQVYTRKSEGGWDQRPCLSSVRPKSLPVFIEFSVEAPGTPTVENFFHCRFINPEQIRKRLEVWSKGSDYTDIQVSIGPAIQPIADAWRKGVIDSRMADGALNAY